MYEFHLFELRNDKVNVRKIITVIHVHVKLQLTGMQLEKESLKKFRLARIQTMTSAIPIELASKPGAGPYIFLWYPGKVFSAFFLQLQLSSDFNCNDLYLFNNNYSLSLNGL